jgi:hypothetical protein
MRRYQILSRVNSMKKDMEQEWEDAASYTNCFEHGTTMVAFKFEPMRLIGKNDETLCVIQAKDISNHFDTLRTECYPGLNTHELLELYHHVLDIIPDLVQGKKTKNFR